MNLPQVKIPRAVSSVNSRFLTAIGNVFRTLLLCVRRIVLRAGRDRHSLLLSICVAVLLLTGTIFVLAELGGYGQNGPATAPNSLDRGLVAHWDMEEGGGQAVKDKSGNGHDVTLGASAAAGGDDPVFVSGHDERGAAGTALQFDGVDDYAMTTGIEQYGASSISVWLNGTRGSSVGGIAYYTAGSSYQRWGLSLEGGNINSRISNGTVISNWSIESYNATNYPDGWHLITLTDDGTTRRFYRDGVYISQRTNTLVNAGSGGAFYLGKGGGTFASYFPGALDDIRVYNRALSADEIQLLYNQKAPILDLNMDEGRGIVVHDSSGNGYDGTLGGGTADYMPGWAAGKYQGALAFDGQNDYASLSPTSLLKGSWSVSAWVNPGDSSTRKFFFSQGTAYFELTAAGRFYAYAPSSGTALNLLSDSTYYTAGRWYHVEVTYDGSQGKMYVDGNLVASGNSSGTTTAGTTRVGAYGSSLSNFFKGSVDSLRVYQYARTQSEVQADYNNSLAAHLGVGEDLNLGLTGYWNMEEGGGQTLADGSGLGHAGTLGSSSSADASDPVFSSGHDSVGEAGSGLNFDGQDDYVDLSSTPQVYSSAYSISMWVKGAAAQGDRRILSEGSSSNNSPLLTLGTDTAGLSGKLDIYLRDGVGTVLLNHVQSTQNAFDSSWHHVVWTDAAGSAHVYIDGVPAGSFSYTPSGTGLVCDHTALGAVYRAGLGNFFSGSIDEVRFYGRALSGDEVRRLYNRKQPVLAYDFDEGSGAVAHDASFHHNDATLVASPSYIPGRSSTALSLDALKSQYGYAADSPSLSLPGDLTLSAWINPASTTASIQFDVVGKWGSGDESYLLSQYGDEIRVYLGSSANYKTTDAVNLSPVSWYHVEAVYSAASQNVDIFVNGVLQPGTVTGTIPSSLADGTGRLQVGSEYSTTAAVHFYDGAIDEVRVYSYARTPDEVRVDYNDGLGVSLGRIGQDLDRGLLGHWDFSEGGGQTVHDKSGNGNDGLLGWTSGADAGDPVFVPGHDAAGAGGTGLQFDGQNDYVYLGSGDRLNVNSGFSLSVWIKPLSAQHDSEILSRVAGTPHQGFGVYYDADGSYYDFFLTTQNSPWSDSLILNSVTLGSWQHLVVTYDNVNTARFYLNGALIKTDTTTWSGKILNAEGADAYLGCAGWGGSPDQKVIDEVRLYDRAISQDEVAMLYNQKKPILSLDFDDGSGTVAHDQSFNRSDGILSGGVAWTQGKFGSALSYNGTDGFVYTPNSTLFQLQVYTFSVWIKAVDFNQYRGILETDMIPLDTSAPIKGRLMTFGGNTVRFHPNYADGGANNYVLFSNLPTDTWLHLEATWDGTTAIGYLNGVNIGQLSYSTPSTYAYTPRVQVGKNANMARYFNGLIDNVRVYNYARTPGEVLVDYNDGLAAHLR